MEAGSCLHGTKVASLCQRLTFALAHPPECTPAYVCCDGAKHAQHLYSHTPVLAPAHGASSALSNSATQLSGCQGHRTVSASAMALASRCRAKALLLLINNQVIRGTYKNWQALGVLDCPKCSSPPPSPVVGP